MGDGRSAESGLDTVVCARGETPSSSRVEPVSMEEGERFGRYAILERIGSGGMGVVYAAFDAKLDRKVALKVLHHRSDAERRLLREARSLAKLTHPNVVTIHDAGEHDGHLYIAMEFAEGVTLARWLRAGNRSRPQILHVFMQAAEGLAAAHDAGLVHRDFKPDNVMVAETGRVLVMDFGLALPSATGEEPTAPGELELHEGKDTSLAGTPAYMAPEQFGQGPLTEHTDQFAFCVALYEALHGTRPFVSDELSTRVAARLRRKGPGDVPPELDRAIRRGLARDPADRHANMRALIAALGRRPRRGRGVWIGALGGTAVVAAGIGLASMAIEKRKCDANVSTFSDVWNDDTRTEVRDAFAATGLPFGEETANHTAHLLDIYAHQWATAREQACYGVERWARTEVPEVTCLEAIVDELEVKVELWRNPQGHAVAKAPLAVLELAPPGTCLDPEVLAEQPALPTDPEKKAAIRAVRRRARRAHALFEAGQSTEALREFEAVRRDAEAAGPEWLVAMAAHELGRAYHHNRRDEEAKRSVSDAYFLAGRARADHVAAKAAGLMAAITAGEGDKEAAKLWADNAQMMASRGKVEGTLDYVSVLGDLGKMHDALGDMDAAVEKFREARTLALSLAPRHVTYVTAVSLGNALRRHGDMAEAETYLTEAIDTLLEISGGNTPDLVTPLLNRGSLRAQQNRFEEARADLLAARDVAEAADKDGAQLIKVYGALGAVSAELGEFETALDQQQRALALQTRRSGADHVDNGYWHMNLGVTLAKLGRHDEARKHYERALELRIGAHGEDHPMLVATYLNLGELERREENPAAALPYYEKGHAIAEAKMKPGHPQRIVIAITLGETLFELERAGEAQTVLRQALSECNDETPPDHRAAIEHNLALAMAALGSDGSETEALARAALMRLEETGGDPGRRKDIEAWLARR